MKALNMTQACTIGRSDSVQRDKLRRVDLTRFGYPRLHTPAQGPNAVWIAGSALGNADPNKLLAHGADFKTISAEIAMGTHSAQREIQHVLRAGDSSAQPRGIARRGVLTRVGPELFGKSCVQPLHRGKSLHD